MRRERNAGVEHYQKMWDAGGRESFQDDLHNSLQNTWGAICLAAVNNDLLMWAHYADHHRGFVIKFDCTHQSFRALGFPHAMDYSECLPVYHVGMQNSLKLYLTKWEQWRYEQEFRILRSLTDCQQIPKDRATVFVLPLLRSSVRAIYLGCRASDELAKRAADVCGSTIAVFRTSLLRDRFGVEFRQISGPALPAK
jgi:hypothetical protein